MKSYDLPDFQYCALGAIVWIIYFGKSCLTEFIIHLWELRGSFVFLFLLLSQSPWQSRWKVFQILSRQKVLIWTFFLTSLSPLAGVRPAVPKLCSSSGLRNNYTTHRQNILNNNLVTGEGVVVTERVRANLWISPGKSKTHASAVNKSFPKSNTGPKEAGCLRAGPKQFVCLPICLQPCWVFLASSPTVRSRPVFVWPAYGCYLCRNETLCPSLHYGLVRAVPKSDKWNKMMPTHPYTYPSPFPFRT